MALDRENAPERRLQALGLAAIRGDGRLQKPRIGIELGRQQKRHGQHVVALGKALANAFFLGKGVRHVSSTKGSCSGLKRPQHAAQRPAARHVGKLPACSRKFRRRTPTLAAGCYLISAVAPASTSCFRMPSASALDTASLTGFGAPSTRSLASFSPRPVTARTTLI